jgi:hypothetical protein
MTCDHQLEIVVFPDHEMTSTKYHAVRTVLKYHAVRTVPKYHAVRTVPKSNRKIAERGKIDTLGTQIHDL